MLSRSRCAGQTRHAPRRFQPVFRLVNDCPILSATRRQNLTCPLRSLLPGEGMRLFSFRETTSFTRRVLEYLGDESYARLQWYLLRRPEAGDLMPGSGGLRKVRWAAVGKGKRGGARVIYYWAAARDLLFMLDIYAKGEKEDLTPDELKELRRLVEEWLS